MKNKRILIFTVAIICGFVLLIMLGSKAVNSTITTGNETENQLSAEIPQDSGNENIVFDYPYIKLDEIDNYKDSDFHLCYKLSEQFFNGNFGKYNYKIMEPADGLLSYQQVANITGEKLKYIYGITYHQAMPALITCTQEVSGEMVYKYEIYNQDTESVAPIVLWIDAVTGKVTGIYNARTNNVQFNDKITDEHAREVTDDMKDKLSECLASDLELLGYKEQYKIEKIYMDAGNGYILYTVFLVFPDDLVEIQYITSDNDYFELTHLYTIQESDMYE